MVSGGTATASSLWRIGSPWRYRLTAPRFSRFAACCGAPSHRLPQGSGLRQLWLRIIRLHQGIATGEMGFRGHFARQQSRTLDVRYGSKADIAASPTNV